ncbi:MAG: aldehyde dehydrogenase family protein [Pseudomonadota bacterium]
MASAKYQYSNFINGAWAPQPNAVTQSTSNPAHPQQEVGRYEQADLATVDAAVAAATNAQKKWRGLSFAERRSAYERLVSAIESNVEGLAEAITLEMGKPLREARNEVLKSCAEARFMSAHALEVSGGRNMPALRSGMKNEIRLRPRGVIAAIAPWNFPVMTPMRKLAPALAYGNAIILKPSEFTPAACCMLADLTRGTLPPGLLQVVHGGPQVADYLVRHPGVQGVTFTGSVATGRKIRSATASNLAETALEMGGKNAAVIHDVDDIESCLDQITDAAFMSSGQRCTAVSRVLVRRDLHDTVVAGLARRAEAFTLGDGLVPTSDLGPMTHPAQLAHVEGMVRRALNEGAQIAAGGNRAVVPGCIDGLFYSPTVLRSVQPTMEIAREEVFGPVLCVIPYDTLEEAISILNATEYGLTAALFSHDTRVVERFVGECQTGMLHVNHGTIPDSHMPFGGIKSSGVGAYSVGPSAASFYTTEHAVYVGA